MAPNTTVARSFVSRYRRYPQSRIMSLKRRRLVRSLVPAVMRQVTIHSELKVFDINSGELDPVLGWNWLPLTNIPQGYNAAHRIGNAIDIKAIHVLVCCKPATGAGVVDNGNIALVYEHSSFGTPPVYSQIWELILLLLLMACLCVIPIIVKTSKLLNLSLLDLLVLNLCLKMLSSDGSIKFLPS